VQLNSEVALLSRLTKDHASGLARLSITTIKDLLFHFPVRYADMREIGSTKTLAKGEAVTLFGILEKVTVKRSFRGHIPMTEARLRDASGTLRLVWFNQAYIGKMYTDDTKVKIQGIIQEDSRGFFLTNPSIEKIQAIPEPTESLFTIDISEDGKSKEQEPLFLTPVYPETKGVSSLYLYTLIKKIFTSNLIDTLEDPIPEDILKKLHLPSLKDALTYIHFPKEHTHTVIARKRFAFEEIFYLQIKQNKEKQEAKNSLAYPITVQKKELKEFMERFPFTPTQGQYNAIDSILSDLKKTEPMGRLLEGDVGSGKTFVAATVAYMTLLHANESSGKRLQVAYMAPTEILAKQHFESFITYLQGTGIEIGLLTGSGCKKYPSKGGDEVTNISKAQLRTWLHDGRVSIVIGTHALIQKTITFDSLALIIIDEQHRFGVKQRKLLAQKGRRNNAEQAEQVEEYNHTLLDEKKSNLLYETTTYTLREALFTIKKELGGGHKEIIYERALEEELTRKGIRFSRQVSLPVLYRDKQIGTYRPDFIIEDSIILELKALSFIGAEAKKQLWTYLKNTKYSLGILVNFSPTELQIQRVVYDTARTSSASVPPSSAVSAYKIPHLLSMTATPIPRTLALTMFGDLDLTVLDEVPKERKRIITEIVRSSKRKEIYEKVREELRSGRQVYVICPRIEEDDEALADKQMLRSVKEEAKRLSDTVFPEYVIDILHSKMKKEEKEEVMQDFLDKKSDILVATSVVEVGVNVPNASVIIIEHADRFGLAQLHQLRGRVGRAEHQSYCYLFTEGVSEVTYNRLISLVKAKNGFELAEMDMLARGIGTLNDGKQWGLSDLAMEAIKNPKLVEIAQQEAKLLIEKDTSLNNHPHLRDHIKTHSDVHME
jgi:ATP-dependent DNA helicase RecG